MITVGGFNTSLDKLVEAGAFQAGQVNRASSVRTYPGGKGLHVAQTVAALGESVNLVGLVDAAHRAFFEDTLAERGVVFHGVESGGEVRTCLAIRDREGRVTELLEPGPEVDEATRGALMDLFMRLAAQSDLAVLSGSLPPGLGEETYAELVTALKGVRCLVDASGGLLRQALTARPFLVKPNRDEAADLLGQGVGDVAGAAAAVRALGERGVVLPVVSLGADGAVMLHESRVLHAFAPVESVSNAVGSGDCLLAGLAVGLARGKSVDDALRLGVACGAANAAAAETGYARREDVEEALARVTVRSLYELDKEEVTV